MIGSIAEPNVSVECLAEIGGELPDEFEVHDHCVDDDAGLRRNSEGKRSQKLSVLFDRSGQDCCLGCVIFPVVVAMDPPSAPARLSNGV